MTSTSFNVGLGESSRNSSKVLKPPGGGTSDIFGTSEVVEQSPRTARNTHYQQSSVFGTNDTSEPVTTPRTKPGNDSHNRLFGPVESRPQTTCKNRMKSNIHFGAVGSATGPEFVSNSTSSKSANPSSVTGATVENGQQETSMPKARRNPVTGVGVSSSDYVPRRRIKKRDGNPVTGEGYSAVNGEKVSPLPPAATTTNGTGSAEVRRNRVPPGGYSSGLW